MKLLALVKGPASIARYLATEGEATEVQLRSPGRGPPYWRGGGGRGGQTRWRSGGGDSVGKPRGGAVCARRGAGATEHSPGGAERTCRGAIGGARRQGLAARDDAG